MKQLLLILSILPALASAQEVMPVLSRDYLELINKNNVQGKIHVLKDTSNSIKNSSLKLVTGYPVNKIRQIKIINNAVSIVGAENKSLSIGGTLESRIVVKKINSLPALQNEYAQGQSANGQLQWFGPETNVQYSFGPAIASLEYDGSSYPYDVNGRLVPAGTTGKGKKAAAYDNSVFRTGTLVSTAFNIHGTIRSGRREYGVYLNAGSNSEITFIRENRNEAVNISTGFNTTLKNIKLKTTWTYLKNSFYNSNRNGFLNRIYQQAILTPASFNNAEAAVLSTGQRSYGINADNPYFLLKDNGNAYTQTQKNGSLALDYRHRYLTASLLQSVQLADQNAIEAYRPGTAGFQDGISTKRYNRNLSYMLKANATFNLPIGNKFRYTLSGNYIFSAIDSRINYSSPASRYRYNRESHDINLIFSLDSRQSEIQYGVNLDNKACLSNTCRQNSLFLPGIAAYARISDLLNINRLSLKLVTGYTKSASEPAINQSYAGTALSGYSTAQSARYFPTNEVTGFNGLELIKKTEYKVAAEFNYNNSISFSAEIFERKTRNDVFPVLQNSAITLMNLADHRNRGAELELNFYESLFNLKKIQFSSSVSFTKYTDKVTEVAPGFDNTVIAGFSNVNKIISKGSQLGVISGSSFKRDANNNLIIGTDGFPLVNGTSSIIGNPVPDFIMKINHSLRYKKFSFGCGWEWKKGGDMWNGTQAVLDYYGRSLQSAQMRNTEKYIFPGVLENGQPNNIPVSFYDPALPVEKNRWVRYGQSGVAAAYIQDAGTIRINNLSLSYLMKFKKCVQQVSVTAFASNILLWSAYNGTDPGQFLNDDPATSGLDYFNLPSTKNYGVTVSIQF